MTDLRQSQEYAKYLKSVNWNVKKIDSIYVYFKKLPFLGWFAKIQHPSLLTKKTIDFIETNYHPFQFSIEPLSNNNLRLLKELNFKLSYSPSLPSKTLILDLTKSEKDLLNSFSQKTRYNIRLAVKRQVKVVESEDIFYFAVFWRENFEKKRFPFFSQQKNIIALHKSFGNSSKLLFAKRDNQVIAVLLLLYCGKTAFYMYAASDNIGRKNFAPTLLTWEGIKLAKKSGCMLFDFDGIYDERFPIASWQGFTKFKKGFRGQEIEYPGCFVKTKFGSIIH